MCGMCQSNHERREGRGGTSRALAPLLEVAIDLKITMPEFHLDFHWSRFYKKHYYNSILEKNTPPEALQSKQDQFQALAGYPFGHATFRSVASANVSRIATAP